MLGQELVRLAEGLLDSELELVNAAVQLGLPPAFSEVLAIEENSCNIHISVAVRRDGGERRPDARGRRRPALQPAVRDPRPGPSDDRSRKLARSLVEWH